MEGVLAQPGQGSKDFSHLLSWGREQGEGLSGLWHPQKVLVLPTMLFWSLPGQENSAGLGSGVGWGPSSGKRASLAPLYSPQASYLTGTKGSG